jgi:hypothetical protein
MGQEHLPPAMKILLRHISTGLFYVGPDQWSNDPANALDFERPDLALDRVCDTNLESMELVMHFEEVAFDLPARIHSPRAR